MNRRAFGRALLAAASTLALGAREALAGSLTPDERAALERGEVVRRPVDADLDAGLYLGGVSYALVDAPAPFVLAMLQDPAVYMEILALTLEATPTGAKGKDQLVFFKHGGSLGTASYTMRIQPADPTGTIRFWMDPAFEHEIEDIWGYVRVEALGSETCLATYAVLCDLGTLFRVLFGEKIREFALDTPGNIRFVAGSRYQRIQSPSPAASAGGQRPDAGGHRPDAAPAAARPDAAPAAAPDAVTSRRLARSTPAQPRAATPGALSP